MSGRLSHNGGEQPSINLLVLGKQRKITALSVNVRKPPRLVQLNKDVAGFTGKQKMVDSQHFNRYKMRMHFFRRSTLQNPSVLIQA